MEFAVSTVTDDTGGLLCFMNHKRNVRQQQYCWLKNGIQHAYCPPVPIVLERFFAEYVYVNGTS